MSSLFRSCLILIGLFLFATVTLHAESLEDALGVGKTDVRESSAETKKLWDGMVLALENTDFAAALPLANQFNDVKDFTEPYQKTFAACVIQILTPSTTAEKPDVEKQAAIALKKKDASDAALEIEQKKKQIGELRDKRDNAAKDASKKSKDSDSDNGEDVGKAIAGRFGISIGGGKKKKTDAGTAPSKEHDTTQDRITDLEADIKKAEARKQTAEQAVNSLESQIVDAKGSQTREIRTNLIALIAQLQDNGNARAAAALAGAYIKKIGADAEISKIAQACIDTQKAEAKAISIAKAASKPITDCLDANKLWGAKAELEKANDLIKQRITDDAQLKFVQREMTRIAANLDNRIKEAIKKRDTILDAASRDAADGLQRFDTFVKNYADYPNIDQDKIKLGDLRQAQLQKKFEKQLAAIQEVIQNDPEAAKGMIKKLLDSDLNPEEAAIMSSRIVALKRSILDREVAIIQKQMDEAQSYLTTFNPANYTAELKTDKGSAEFTQKVTSGVENMVRSRSVQAGAIKRLEMLIAEETDNITKSKFVGQLETNKAALAQMDEGLLTCQSMLERSRNQASKDQMLLIAEIVGGLLLLGAVIFWLLKSKSAAQPQVAQVAFAAPVPMNRVAVAPIAPAQTMVTPTAVQPPAAPPIVAPVQAPPTPAASNIAKTLCFECGQYFEGESSFCLHCGKPTKFAK